jgi:hypothetical protein
MAGGALRVKGAYGLGVVRPFCTDISIASLTPNSLKVTVTFLEVV